MADSTFDEFFENDFYSAPTSINNSKNHVKNVRNSIQIKHSMSSRSLNEFTKDIPPSATTGSTTTKSNTQTNPSSSKVGNTSGSTRTSIIKASPSLKALESILNEKNKQYNTTNTNIIEEVEEETEETEKVGIAKNHSQGLHSLSPPILFNYNNSNNRESVQTFETAIESLNEDDTLAVLSTNTSNSIGNNSNNNNNSNGYPLTTKTSKSSSVNSHKYNKSSISTISESGYSTDDTPIISQPLTFQSFTPHSFESPQLKMVDITEESNFENENSNSTITTNTIMAKNESKNNLFCGVSDGGVDVGSAGGGAQYNKNKFNANFSNKQIKENFHSSSQQLFQQQEHHHQPSFHQSPLNSTDQQMSPKSSEPLHPPRHVKHPTDTTTNTTTNNNNPFYNTTSHSNQNNLFNKNVSIPLNQPAYPGNNTTTTTNTNNHHHNKSNSYNNNYNIIRTVSNNSNSNMSLDSNFSSHSPLNNNSSRPKIVRKSKSMLTVLTNDNDSMSSSHTPPPRSPLPPQPTNDSVSLGSPHKRPSQPRSNSSYSIMKGKFNRKNSNTTTSTDFHPENKTLLHKRSNTLNDFSKLNKEQQPSSGVLPSTASTNLKSSNGKKKFSFKSLFKSKSKSHSLNESNSSILLEPKKMTSKSYSTPNMQMLSEQPKSIDDVEDTTNNEQSTKLESKAALPTKTNTSFMNRFKKNKSSDSLNKLGSSHQQSGLKKGVSNSNPSLSSLNGNKPVVNSTNNNNLIQPNEEHSKFGLLAPPVNRNSFNFIREVSEDSVYIGDQNDDIEDEHSGEEDIKPSKKRQGYKDVGNIHNNSDDEEDDDNVDRLSNFKSIERGQERGASDDDDDDDDQEKEKDFDYYDAQNLTEDPPKKLSSGNKYGEEISLIPPLIDSNQFGSPFKVNYQSSPKSIDLKREAQHTNTNDDDDNSSPLQRTIKRFSGPPTSSSLIPIKPPLPIRYPQQQTNNNVHVTEDKPNTQLFGEALFPKSLNAHEVESIVSLERSRSMKSVKSNKRSSFVNYDGSDDNIVHYVGPISKPTTGNNGNNGITRSNSILKNSTSRKSNLNEELKMNSIDGTVSGTTNNNINNIDTSGNFKVINDTTTTNNDTFTTITDIGPSGGAIGQNILGSNNGFGDNSGIYIGDDDLMEFSEFIDVENMNFLDSPIPGSPINNNGKFMQSSTTPSSPLANYHFDNDSINKLQQQEEELQLQGKIVDQSTPEPPVIVINKDNLDDKPTTMESKLNSIPVITIPDKETIDISNKDSIDSKTPTSSPLSMKHDDSPKTSVEEKDDDQHQTSNEKANNNDIIDDQVIIASPILESAYRIKSQRSENGKFTKQNRPISMSFKGMNAPSFTGKLKKEALRSSDSHQSFNINFNDDDDGDDDSSLSVGGGFGSSSEDEDDDAYSFEQGNEISSASRFYNTNDDYIENKENRVPGSAHTNNSNSTANDKVSPLIPPPPTNSQPNIIAQPQSPAPSTKSSVFSPKQSNDINKKPLNQPPPPPSSSPPQTQQHFSLQPLKKFTHNKIPSISDQSSINSESSPRSFTSMISKKWGNRKNNNYNPSNSPNSNSSPKFNSIPPRPAPPPPPPPPPPQVGKLQITNGVRFSSRIILYDTYNEDEYDRHPDTATCNQLTPLLAQQIKDELNSFKSEMEIHVESKCYTHFF